MASHLAAAGLLLCLSVAVVVPWVASGEGELGGGGGAGCQRSCGSMQIPFPFGMGPDPHCWLPGFNISCNDIGNNGVFKPFMVSTTGDLLVELLSISPEDNQARVLYPISYSCDQASTEHPKEWSWEWDLTNTPYSLSTTANKFMVLGCPTLAFFAGARQGQDSDLGPWYKAGCFTLCYGGALSLNPCNGIGCCKTDIPNKGQFYRVAIQRNLFKEISTFSSPCTFAVPMEFSNFTSTISSKNNLSFSEYSNQSLASFNTSYGGKAPVVLEWSIGQDDCNTAPTKPDYACVSSNSLCSNATSGRGGYICKCKNGFEGNPYLPDGCQDIDECRVNNPCYFGECKNTVGGFTCHCPTGKKGNAYIRGGCRKDYFPPRARIATGILAGLLAALLIGFLSIQVYLNKKNKKIQRNFEQHGGRMLSRILETDGIAFKFYNRGELVKATNGFDKANIIGEGAHGSVYKATLGTATVAVKQCKQIDKTKKEEFVQELVVLCRVSHQNIVKLIGCCLHFEAPVLVYEFVPNGTLSKLLHGMPRRRVTLPTRLRIAAQTAEALAHLHSPPHPTLHGDIKPENILLGEGYAAKVSDFGCSTINDNKQVVPKGTLAYLDPQFLKDFQITEKTDVYSFGVVLIELLTRKNPLTKENLTVMFQERIGNGTLGDLLDPDIVKEGSMELINAAAKLVGRCIAAPGNARPTMGQVATELRQLSDKMPESSDEAQVLLEVVEDDRHSYTGTDGENTGFSNLPALSTELAR